MVIRDDEPYLRSQLYHDFRLDAGQNDRDSLSWDAQNSRGDVCCSPKIAFSDGVQAAGRHLSTPNRSFRANCR